MEHFTILPPEITNAREPVAPDTGTHHLLPPGTVEESAEDLIFEFIRERTPTTAASYRDDLKAFFEFTQKYFAIPRIIDGRAHFEDVKRVHLVKYKNFLETEPCQRGRLYAPNSVNRKLSSISSFYQFLVRREIIDKNPVSLIVRPRRVVVRETEAFTDREMKHLFEIVLEQAPILHKVTLLALFTTGMRNAEIRNIKLKDFQIHKGVRVLRYVGKGQKVNQISIHPATAHYLDLYLKWMEEKGRKIGPDDYLFQPTKNSHGGKLQKKLSHTALGYIVKKWTRKVNPSKRMTPHSSRATFISSLLENGTDIYTVAQTCSHSDVRTTQRYDKRSRKFNRSPVFGLNFF